ncbi:MAG: glycosyl hydrolase family 43, partial [Bacteroidota bacterium]|nr:glycosyl hydrolase family 43 [Bacteroidota bacterium]
VFRQRRGYSVLPYLPALTGRVLHTVLHTEQFLWDVRRTQADLMAENYYGRFAELCRQKGFTSYAEPYDKGTFEEMQVGSRVDVAMGEFWYGLHALLQGNRAVERTSRLAASIMHTAGRKIVGAESFTSEPESSRWQEYPFSLKALGDKMLCQGLNKLIIHRFAHQPNPFAKPGMTMGPWGIHFDRTNTWFGVAGGWLRYLSRCQVLLREGWPVKDLLYFTGEEANVYTRVNRDELFPQPPLGFDYDLINADTILNKASIKDGFITLPHGMQYRILVLQDYKRVTFRLLQKLRQLVAAGMLLVGQKPAGLLGLGDAKNEAAFKTTADELWPEPYNEKEGHHTLGKGQVYWGASLAPLLEALSLKPDFECSSRSGDAPIQAVHRRSGDTDIYFISNQRRSFEEIVCSFRVKGKQPQIWDPGSGIAYPAVVYEAANEVVRVPVVLEPYGSRFILFRTAGEKEGILTIRKDGETMVAAEPFPARARKLFTSVSNNFTIALWAKPEMNIMTKASQHMGNLPHPYTDYYAIYPSQGETLYGAGHATAGLTIGRNGVGVWENAVYPKLTLVAEAPVAGWSHIAVVYEEGVPSVYINGSRVAKGSKSASVVHPGVGQAFMSEGASYFNGDRSEPNVWDKALGEEELRKLAAEAPTVPPEFPQLPEVAVHNGKPALLLWQNGSYELQRLRSKVSFLVKEIDPSIEIARNWKLLFPPRSGAPHIVLLQALHSLHLHAEDGVKHFSGTVHYQNTFKSNRDYRTGNRRLFLDLGRVEVIAQVTVNGKDLGTLWKRPYLVDISAAVRKGINQLEVKVTNLWPNRLIGDEKVAASEAGASAGSSGFEHLAGTGFETFIGRPVPVLPDWYVQGDPKPDDGKVAFATWQHYTKEDPLLESGLIGPVVLRTAVLKGIETE